MNARTDHERNDRKPTNDQSASAEAKGGERPSHEQPDAGIGRKQAGQTDRQNRQADRHGADAEADETTQKARTADSSPGDPPADRAGTASPDGAVQSTPRGASRGVEGAAVAEPGRGQLASDVDRRVDVGTADSTPAPDGEPTGSDRDTLKPGV